ncbi:RDD family protein [Candidatus Bipolaricaulota bacterium]|nr:RDD family protein [Candidatus Bipolaricaulota bacterium]
MSFRLAARRLFAYGIDVALLFAILAPMVFVAEKLTGLVPETPGEVWQAIVLGFSIPVWAYFALCDASPRGETLGKRLLKLQVVSMDGQRLGLATSLARTALKLLPWEMAHVFGFALAEQIGGVGQAVGLIAANGLLVLYLCVVVITKGKRTVHDFILGTEVRRTLQSIQSIPK